MNRICCSIAFRVIVFLLPIFFSLVPAASGQESSCPHPVTPGQWTSTGIQVTKGENVYIQASGAFQYKDGERRSFGPVGDMYGVWALQAKIGEEQIELIGAKNTFAAKADGVLEVGAPSRLGRPINEGIDALDPSSKYCIPLINVFGGTGMNTVVRIKTTASCEVEDNQNVKPMGGVKVTIGDKTVTSDANGDAVIGLKPGEYIVLAAPPPDSDAVQGRVYQAGVLNRPSEVAKIEVRRGITEAIEVRMKTCDETGQPKARAKIAQIGKSMEVRIIRPDGTVFRQAATVGQILRDGDYLIVTGTGKLDWLSGGTVEFLHPGGSEIRIGPVMPKGTQGVSITKGLLRFWFSDPDACTKSVCFSPKGTIYTVGHDDSTGISTLDVEEGSVEVIPLNRSLTGLTAFAGQRVEIGPTAVRRIGENIAGGGATGFGPMHYGEDIADAGDYKALDLPEARPELCESECAKDPRCRAYAYVRPGTYDYPRPRCWLKEKTGRFIPHANAVSAVKGGAGSTPVTQSNADVSTRPPTQTQQSPVSMPRDEIVARPPSVAAANEWNFIQIIRWDQIKTGSIPGDGSVTMRIIRADERGGEAEAHIEMSQAVCARGGLEAAPGAKGETEVIGFTWTFGAPILRLRPKDRIPVTVSINTSRSSQKCPGAAAFRSAVTVDNSETSGVGSLIPEPDSRQYWSGMSRAPIPPAQGARYDFVAWRPEDSRGTAVLEISELTPAPNQPQRGYFVISFSTNAAMAGGNRTGFFYTYEYGRPGGTTTSGSGTASGNTTGTTSGNTPGRLSGKFGLRTACGGHLNAVRGGGIQGPGAINSDASQVSGWETFTLVPLPDGTYAIQTSSGNYLTAVEGGGLTGADVIHTDATQINAWEKFTLVDLGNGEYAIKTVKGNYLTAVNGGCIGGGKGAIHTNATTVGAWEKFKLIGIDQPSPTGSGGTTAGGSTSGGGGSGTTGENNTDRYGMDYKTLELPQANPDICRDACAGDPNCKAWTYLRPNIYGPNAYCYLKSGVPPATPNACCVSGVKGGSPEPTRDAIAVSWSTGAPYRGQNIRVTYNCPPGGSANMGSIWGTDYYTYDSSVCIAAVHAGLISFASGGKVTFEMRQGAASYRGSTRNGVTSRDWGAYDGSYVFVR